MHKYKEFALIKSADDAGTISGYFSTYDRIPDSYGDVVLSRGQIAGTWIGWINVKDALVEGDEENIKLTKPLDLLLAAAILRDRRERNENRTGV